MQSVRKCKPDKNPRKRLSPARILDFSDPRLPVSAQAAAGGGFYFSSRFMIARNTFKQMLADAHAARQRQHIRSQRDRALQSNRFCHPDAANAEADEDQIGDRKEQTALHEGH